MPRLFSFTAAYRKIPYGNHGNLRRLFFKREKIMPRSLREAGLQSAETAENRIPQNFGLVPGGTARRAGGKSAFFPLI